jgi:endogenous inhibitor of DNA gyrase (YacG/DUF329 family)
MDSSTDKTQPLIVKCPNCKADVEWSEKSPFRPFCSGRCKNTDFIGWANEQHQLPGDVSIEDSMSEDFGPEHH